MSITLLENENSNTNGDAVTANVYPKIIAVWATDFSSGTVSLETTPDEGVTWIPITRGGSALSYTANAVDQISGLIAVGMPIRAVLSGASTPSNVNAVLYEYVG